MITDNTALIIELWSRIKSHIPVKERLDVADQLVMVFDEFGLADDLIDEQDLDKELRAAVISQFGDAGIDEIDDEGYNDEY